MDDAPRRVPAIAWPISYVIDALCCTLRLRVSCLQVVREVPKDVIRAVEVVREVLVEVRLGGLHAAPGTCIISHRFPLSRSL